MQWLKWNETQENAVSHLQFIAEGVLRPQMSYKCRERYGSLTVQKISGQLISRFMHFVVQQRIHFLSCTIYVSTTMDIEAQT